MHGGLAVDDAAQQALRVAVRGARLDVHVVQGAALGLGVSVGVSCS